MTPGLTFDAATHTYAFDGRRLPSVTQVLREVGILDFSAPWFSEAVRDRGTYVHQAIALDVEGDLDEDTLDPALVPYVAAWRRYRAEAGVTVEHVEHAVCDPELGYAGTLDAIVGTPDRPTRKTILDFKLGIYPGVGPQTSAYARCAAALYPTPVIFSRAALELRADGTYRLHPLTDRQDEAVFLAALRIVQYRARHTQEAA